MSNPCVDCGKPLPKGWVPRCEPCWDKVSNSPRKKESINFVRRTWCGQCDRMVYEEEGRLCSSKWCGVKA